MKCPYCVEKVGLFENFCSYCGMPLPNKKPQFFGIVAAIIAGIGFCAYFLFFHNVAVKSVSLNQSSLSLDISSKKLKQLTATIAPANATNKSVRWNSTNPAVAEVTTQGLVTAKSEGTATITATTEDGKKTATCKVTVYVGVTSVMLGNKNSSTTLEIDRTYQLYETISPANATFKTVRWSSDNSSVASVSVRGLVTAKSAGTAIITVTTEDGGKTATFNVTVTSSTKETYRSRSTNVTSIRSRSSTISPISVTLNMRELILYPGSTEQLTATIYPAFVTRNLVRWSSSNTSVATVNDQGMVTAKSTGTATITVTTVDGGKSAACVVTVTRLTRETSGSRR